MQIQLKTLLEAALTTLHNNGALPSLNSIAEAPTDIIDTSIVVEYTHNKQHGDFTTNVALLLAKKLRQNPLTLASAIVGALPHATFLKEAQAVAPGFINFYLSPFVLHAVVRDILQQTTHFGHTSIGKNKLVIVEFVSANPTGPLHVGHGRGAAFGDTIANLLDVMGFKVHREYYVNDAGRQMHVLALSVWLRYLELRNSASLSPLQQSTFPPPSQSCSRLQLHFPAAAYQGAYIIDIARDLHKEYGARFYRVLQQLYSDIPADEDAGGNKEEHLGALVEKARELLGEEDYQIIFNTSINTILADIKEDLEEFGVTFQKWFHESSLVQNRDIENGIKKLRRNNHVYEKDGALWFAATQFGDNKDRVLVRANGQTTYFASDVGYHLNKYERGFDLLIDVFGADHHGYAPRIKGFLEAMSLDTRKLNVLLVQFAILYRGKQKSSMSTRAGEFVTLRELRDEVGKDATRFFYIMRKNDQHLDFDLELAKTKSLDNPVYYIQYAHARICSVMRQLQEKQLTYKEKIGLENLHLLHEEQEKDLLSQLLRYKSILQHAALHYEPHILANYLRELAGVFHAYYNAHQFLVEDVALCNARLCLINAVKQVLANGLALLGVSCPEMM